MPLAMRLYCDANTHRMHGGQFARPGVTKLRLSLRNIQRRVSGKMARVERAQEDSAECWRRVSGPREILDAEATGPATFPGYFFSFSGCWRMYCSASPSCLLASKR